MKFKLNWAAFKLLISFQNKYWVDIDAVDRRFKKKNSGSEIK